MIFDLLKCIVHSHDQPFLAIKFGLSGQCISTLKKINFDIPLRTFFSLAGRSGIRINKWKNNILKLIGLVFVLAFYKDNFLAYNGVTMK